MRKILFFFAVIISFAAVGQNTGSISGKITDLSEDKEPLIFATVSLKDTNIKEQTNFHGNFEISGIPNGTYTLRVGYLGYESKEIQVLVESGKITQVETGLQILSTSTASLLLTEVNTPTNQVALKDPKQ